LRIFYAIIETAKVFMENCLKEKYESIKKALIKAGFEVDEVVIEKRKTVITIHQCEITEEKKSVMEDE